MITVKLHDSGSPSQSSQGPYQEDFTAARGGIRVARAELWKLLMIAATMTAVCDVAGRRSHHYERQPRVAGQTCCVG